MTADHSASIVVLTGAGISADSGLDTFRDPNGVWSRYRIEEVATPGAFRDDPALVHDFYNMRRRRLLSPEVQPNAAHLALAGLERGWQGGFLLVTQNIDDLHERAGSRKLVHMHGELLKVRCVRSGRIDAWREDLSTTTKCACCGEQGLLRPDVVWFGEIPLEMDRVQQALSRCDIFVSVGTSGSVYPAAGFVEVARGGSSGRRQVRTVELNLEPTAISHLFGERTHGPAPLIVPAFVETLLAGG
jgi:NAD-dependent deacetylase